MKIELKKAYQKTVVFTLFCCLILFVLVTKEIIPIQVDVSLNSLHILPLIGCLLLGMVVSFGVFYFVPLIIMTKCFDLQGCMFMTVLFGGIGIAVCTLFVPEEVVTRMQVTAGTSFAGVIFAILITLGTLKVESYFMTGVTGLCGLSLTMTYMYYASAGYMAMVHIYFLIAFTNVILYFIIYSVILFFFTVLSTNPFTLFRKNILK